jgi:hypothetical protein
MSSWLSLHEITTIYCGDTEDACIKMLRVKPHKITTIC